MSSSSLTRTKDREGCPRCRRGTQDGKASAEACAAEGATVAIADINLETAQTAAAEIGDAAYAVQPDVSNQDSINAAIAAAASRVRPPSGTCRKHLRLVA